MKGVVDSMGKAKKAEPFDPHNLSPQDQLKFEIAQELGLDSKVMESGWRSLTAKESISIQRMPWRRVIGKLQGSPYGLSGGGWLWLV